MRYFLDATSDDSFRRDVARSPRGAPPVPVPPRAAFACPFAGRRASRRPFRLPLRIFVAPGRASLPRRANGHMPCTGNRVASEAYKHGLEIMATWESQGGSRRFPSFRPPSTRPTLRSMYKGRHHTHTAGVYHHRPVTGPGPGTGTGTGPGPGGTGIAPTVVSVLSSAHRAHAAHGGSLISHEKRNETSQHGEMEVPRHFCHRPAAG